MLGATIVSFLAGLAAVAGIIISRLRSKRLSPDTALTEPPSPPKFD
jgi:hypothetical protein